MVQGKSGAALGNHIVSCMHAKYLITSHTPTHVHATSHTPTHVHVTSHTCTHVHVTSHTRTHVHATSHTITHIAYSYNTGSKPLSNVSCTSHEFN